MSNGFGYRAAQDFSKFREFWSAEDPKNGLNLFLKDENVEQFIVQSGNSGSCGYSTMNQTADWIKQRKAMVIIKLIDQIGCDENDMQNEITEEMMGDCLIFMEITKSALDHMHGIFE